jgi:hypothetical protein
MNILLPHPHTVSKTTWPWFVCLFVYEETTRGITRYFFNFQKVVIFSRDVLGSILVFTDRTLGGAHEIVYCV